MISQNEGLVNLYDQTYCAPMPVSEQASEKNYQHVITSLIVAFGLALNKRSQTHDRAWLLPFWRHDVRFGFDLQIDPSAQHLQEFG